jgi:chemotaxis protein CheC
MSIVNWLRNIFGGRLEERMAVTESSSFQESTKLVSKPDNPPLVAVRQDFAGAFSGRALLIFPETNSLELVRAVVGRQLALEDVADLEDEALAEIGNIILNS